jgi:2-methylcitrate dehydratase PrpD
VAPDDREDPALPGYAPYDLVTVLLTDGSTIESRRVVVIRGGPDIPLSRDDLWAKFEDCARVGRLEVSARALFDAFMALEDVPHVRDIPGLAAK